MRRLSSFISVQDILFHWHKSVLFSSNCFTDYSILCKRYIDFRIVLHLIGGDSTCIVLQCFSGWKLIIILEVSLILNMSMFTFAAFNILIFGPELNVKALLSSHMFQLLNW